MTDGEILRMFAEREARWTETLGHVQKYHEAQLGRATLPISWVNGDALGGRTWFGYYWKEELFWFGYGMSGETWMPLIEADRRSAHSVEWGKLRSALPRVWQITETSNKGHFRLWAGEDIARGTSTSQRDWFLERSRELHEFAVHER